MCSATMQRPAANSGPRCAARGSCRSARREAHRRVPRQVGRRSQAGGDAPLARAWSPLTLLVGDSRGGSAARDGVPSGGRGTPPMQRSTDRILTTHTGSLPRPAQLVELLEARDQREARAQPEYQGRVSAAVQDAVGRQAETGIDVLTDGEMGRVAFSWYATERLTGFDGPRRSVMERVEAQMFPEFYAAMSPMTLGLPACTGPITWRGPEYIRQDIATLREALDGVSHAEVFMPAV